MDFDEAIQMGIKPVLPGEYWGRAKNFTKSVDIRLGRGNWIGEGTGDKQRNVGYIVKFKIEKRRPNNYEPRQ